MSRGNCQFGERPWAKVQWPRVKSQGDRLEEIGAKGKGLRGLGARGPPPICNWKGAMDKGQGAKAKKQGPRAKGQGAREQGERGRGARAAET